MKYTRQINSYTGLRVSYLRVLLSMALCANAGSTKNTVIQIAMHIPQGTSPVGHPGG